MEQSSQKLRKSITTCKDVFVGAAKKQRFLTERRKMSYLTDTEKRLLFAALRREKEVCQKVDDTKTEDATCRMLASVVESLERKFYYDRFEKDIQKKAVEEFISWCYLNGIDFSYMGTQKTGKQFCEDVIKRYNTEQ